MRVIFRTCRCARGPIGSPDAADVSCVGGGGGGGARVLIFAVLPPAYPRRRRPRRRIRAAPLARTADRVSAVPRGLSSLIRVFHRFRTVLAVRRGPDRRKIRTHVVMFTGTSMDAMSSGIPRRPRPSTSLSFPVVKSRWSTDISHYGRFCFYGFSPLILRRCAYIRLTIIFGGGGGVK